MDRRLAGTRVALAFAGPVDGRIRGLVEQSLDDSGAEPPLRVRALKLPIDVAAMRKALAGHPALILLATRARVADLGKRLGEEFVAGGDSPLWRLLSPQLVEEQSGNAAPPADGVVVARSVPAQSGPNATFLAGFYAGLASAGLPAVGVERTRVSDSAVEAFDRQDLSTVDDLDSEAGRLSLVLLLAGGAPGNYGVKKTARDGVLPSIPTSGG
jgi:hypothetical protein